MRKISRPPLWQLVFGVGLIASAVNTFVLHGSVADLGYDVIGALSVSVMAVRAWRLPPGLRRGWAMIAAGFGVWVVGDVVWSWYEVVLHRTAPYPGLADVLYLLGYPLTAVGLVMLTRRRRHEDRAHGFGDAAIVCLGLSVLVWQLLLDPSIDGVAMDATERVVAIAYPAMDMVLVLLLLRVLFAGRLRSTSAGLVAGSLAITFGADLASAVLTFTGADTSLLNMAWLAGYVLAAAAICHPRVRGVDTAVEQPARAGVGNRARFLLLGGAGCASPLVIIVLTVLHRHVDTILLSLSSVLIFGLVLHRLSVGVRRLAEAAVTQQGLSSALQHRANHDTLTDTVNRPAFVQYAGEALTGASRDGASLVAAFIDLDGFKAINDGAGHFIGDELVIAVADRLKSCLRGTDILSRFGGDEFALLLELSAASRLDEIGQRLVNQFEDAFPTSAGPLHIRASVGLARARPEHNIEDLLAAADAAMYAAKQQGKNRYAVYDAAMQDSVFPRLKIQEILEEALRTDRMEVHYQPIVDIGTGQWRGLEALVRCRTADGGLLQPGEFLPAAEHSGLMEIIDRTVLTTVLRDLAEWRLLPGADQLIVSVNASARALHAADFEQFVLRGLNGAGLPGTALTIELTEDVHVSDPERSAAVMESLRAHGLRIALDDFGTGYSCLAYLNQLPLDIIKIPIQFTRMLTGDDKARALVKTIVLIARTTGAITIAEGIETQDEWNQLIELGCERGQGFFFCRPMPADEITRQLTTASPIESPAVTPLLSR